MRYGEAGEAFASGPGEGEGRGEQNEGGTHHVEIIAQRRWRWLPRQDWWGRHFAESATRTRLPYGRGSVTVKRVRRYWKSRSGRAGQNRRGGAGWFPATDMAMRSRLTLRA